jgi:protein O-GlcNAc transferase
MTQPTVQKTFELAVRLHQSGKLEEAEQLYRQVIALRPDFAEAHYNLGTALADRGQTREAIPAYQQAIAFKPNFPEAHRNLGNALILGKQFDEAIAAFGQAIAQRPDFAEAHSGLGLALKEKGKFDEAIAACRRSIALRPNLPEAHSGLGHALAGKGNLDAAIAAYRQAIKLKPRSPGTYYNLGNALRDKGQFDDAIAAYRQVISLQPQNAEAYYDLGNALASKEQMDEAVAAYEQAIELRPDYAGALNNLGNALKERGQLDESIAAYRRVIALKTDFEKKAHSNLIFAIQNHPAFDAQAIFEELRRWNERHAQPLAKLIQAHPNEADLERRLRIGFVSRDFRDHVIGRNLLPLVREHDRRLFDITCYAQVPHPDAITRQFQEHADRWRDIVGLTDEQVAEQIRADRIDILVDLTLHMSAPLLMVFARKPAPIQVTFGGYPGGTGMDAIDYRLTDPYLDPPGETDRFYRETSLRLPNSFWCYDPSAMDAPTDPINPLPALQNGFVTFGCLNHFSKINDGVLELWAAVMRKVPQSRLLLLGPKGTTRQRIEAKFRSEQITSDRLEWADRAPRGKYLQIFRRIDVCLDTFPYNGHTTSLDALWMGVPVVTLSGKTVAGRAGRSQLTNLGLPELIADTPGQFVRTAVDLASDLPRLSNLRQTLRRRMLDSPLCDAVRFAHGVESCYRQMWRAWCEKSLASNQPSADSSRTPQ